MGEPRELAVDPIDVPASLVTILAGRRWMRDTVGEAGAAVYRLHAGGQVDLFLKHGRGAVAGEVDVEDFGEEHDGWTAMEVWRELKSLLPIAPDPVVTHGDYSLDNVLIEGGVVTGVINLGRLGTADRYQDLAILANCLDEFEGDLAALFFQVYGIVVPDTRKLRLHLCLDEMF